MPDQTNTKNGKVVLVTGSSSGIGKICADYLYSRGFTIYGTSRNPGSENNGYELIAMDIRESESVKQGIDYILSKGQGIDVVLNNAGIGIAGPIEDSSIEDIRRQFNTNFYGTIRVCKAVLPAMRQQQSGLIINCSSIAGTMGLPFQAVYSASKFAIEGMTEGLRMEVRQFGIDVTLIEPGDFKTNFTSNRIKVKRSSNNSPYKPQFDNTLAIMERDEMNGPTPKKIAQLVHKIIHKKSPKVRYTVGSPTQRFATQLKRVLPSKVFEWIIMDNYQLR
ncbi:MAG TPA: SDR family oxidoreductase [bacterium]|nr:SDR family oxidoreductase [bacterium]